MRIELLYTPGCPLAAQARSCRLDVPSDDRVLAALRGSSARGASEKDQPGNPEAPRTP